MTAPRTGNALLADVRAALERGDAVAAEAACRAALGADPHEPRVLGLLAHVLNRSGRPAEAFEAAGASLARLPDFPPSLLERAAAARQLRRWTDMRAALEALIPLSPNRPALQLDLAEAALETGDFATAQRAVASGLSALPGVAAGWRLAARIAHAAKRPAAEIVTALERVVAIEPTAANRVELALALREDFRYPEAAGVLDAAIAAHPDHWPARWARFQYPDDILPPDAAAADAFLARWRAGIADLAARFDAEPGRVDEVRDCIRTCTNFFVHYLGRPLVDEQRAFGALFSRMAERAAPTKPLAPRAPQARIRVGFASSYLRDHTIFKLFAPTIAALDRARFDVRCFHLDDATDASTRWLEARVDRLVASGNIEFWLDELPRHELDVLVHLDVGMAPIASVLAAKRFAPVQCVTWGHPVTTGLPTIDWFLSSDAMEPADGEAHYTEKLFRLPHLGIAYEPPTVEPVVPPSFVARGGDTCEIFFAQSVYKITPVHGDVFARIAEAAPNVRFHLVPHQDPKVRAQLFERFRADFAARRLDAERHVQLHPFLPLAQFLGLAKACDLNLDSIGWSGGNTTLEILAQDVPTLTLPGDLMRSRHTAAMLALLDLPELVATDLDDLVRRCAGLAADRGERERLAALIGTRKSRLQRDRAPVAALEAFLAEVAGRGPNAR